MQRRFITLSRIFHAGVVNFIRNASLAIAAMAVMLVTMTIVLFSIITNAAFKNTIAQITNKISVSAYLLDTTTEVQGKQLATQLQHDPAVKQVTYLNKDAALKAYAAQNASNQNLVKAAATVGNPIPATIQIYPHDLNEIKHIKSILDKPANKKLQTPESPSYNGDRKEAIDNITHATNVLRRIGVITVIIFVVICALIIFNTIQMAIFNRRDEITIMRLLGASTSYIRGPFVVESAIYGFLSGAFSTLLIGSGLQASSNALQAGSLGLLDIDFANQYFAQHFVLLLFLQIGIGIIIGTVSSVIATRRYLKFKTK